MSAITDGKGRLFRPHNYETEEEFEATVVSLADHVFGTSTIYVDVKKRMSGSDIVTIPDGYVIDMTNPRQPELFVIENEIVSHDPFKHIGIQMLKFATSFEDARPALKKLLMSEITKNRGMMLRLEEGARHSSSRNVDDYLENALEGPFRGIVVIDEARPELHRVLEKINANISVLELQTFVDGDEHLHRFDTLYDEEDDIPPQPAKRASAGAVDGREARRSRRAASDTVVVPAREEGFNRVFLGQNQWHEIRIGAAMKERIRYIAAYQVAPISAITHLAEVKEIRPYQDTGKYLLTFKSPAESLPRPIPTRESKNAPQGPIYVAREKLLTAEYLEDAMA